MKNFLFVPVLIALLIAGCMDQESIVSPDNQKNVAEKTWISIPIPNDDAISSEAQFYTGKFISGDQGGKIKLRRVYWSDDGLVKIRAELIIPPESFDGYRLIWYMVDDIEALTDFNPEMDFEKDLTYDLKFENIDLSEVSNPDNVEFAYLDNNGNIQIADYDNLNVDLENGDVEVLGAKIGHFSRYGFVK